jgi:hypothetical protein
MQSRSRGAAAAALAALLAVAASGCSLFTPSPPDSVTEAVDEAVAELRATQGIASVTSRVSPYDIRDGSLLSNPESWVADLAVEAEPDAADLPVLADAVEDSIDGVEATVKVDARLELTVGVRDVLTVLTLTVAGERSGVTPAGQLVGTAEQLAALDDVSSLQLGSPYLGTQVAATASSDVPAVAASVRQLPAFGTGDLAVVSVISGSRDAPPITTRVLMDAASPSPELLTFIAGLLRQPGVASVDFSGVQAPSQFSPEGGWRPVLGVTVDDEPSRASVVSQLEAFAAPQGLDDALPRASFVVTRFTEQAGVTAVDGYVGLPAGSADPGDGRGAIAPVDPAAPPAVAPPAPQTPEELAARMAADEVVVAQFLDAAGDLAGIRGTPTIQTIACETNGVPTGRQVTGSVVIPIFEVADTADEAYAEITKSWELSGLGSGEKAMGREYFTATSPNAVVQRASIRGTVEGLSISVEGRC